MLSIDPGGQYLHILLIDLFLIAARWHYIYSDPDTIFTVLPERLLVQSPALPGNTLQIFLSSPNCSVGCSSLQEGWGWTVWLLCLYSKAWQERRGIWLWKSGACHTAGDSSASTCRAFPRGWTLLSVYLNSAHEGLPEFFSLGDLSTLPALGLLSMHCSINWLLDALEAALLRKPADCVGSWQGL